MLFGQLLLLCVWELGLRQFCRLFYSAIPQKCSSNLTQLLVILLFYAHHSILSNTLEFGATFFGSETRGPLHLRFLLGGWLVGWFGFSFVCNICWSRRLQTIQQRDHSWTQASFTRVCLRIIFYLICVGTEICTMTVTIEITTRESLSTARVCHPVTCSPCYLEKPCNVPLFPFSTVHSKSHATCIIPVFYRSFLRNTLLSENPYSGIMLA